MERMVSALARGTDSARFAVSVLCTKRAGPVSIELQTAAVPVEVYRPAPMESRYLAFVGLARMIRRLQPDIVHTHNSAALFFGTTAACLAGVPRRIHTEHGRIFPDLPKYMLAERMLSHLLYRYVCVSEKTRDDVATFERVAHHKLCVIPNGVAAPKLVSARELRSLRTELRVGESDLVVGTVGRLVAEKGLDSLLRAWAHVLIVAPHAVLVVVGDGPLRATLEAQVNALGITASVRFAGVRTDVSALHSLFDVFVMSSISEGLPLALLESMSAGCAIVATTVGGMPLALAAGQAGLLVAASDPMAMSTAIGRLLLDPAERRHFGVAARSRFENEYHLQRMVDEYQALYSQLDH